MKKALYYPEFKRLTLWVTDQAQQTLYNMTETMARAEIRDLALSRKEIAQLLELVTHNKI